MPGIDRRSRYYPTELYFLHSVKNNNATHYLPQ